MTEQSLYRTTAVSDAASGRVRVDGAEPASLPVAAPDALGGPGRAWNPEALYAAALATCLHQSLVLVASERGCDTSGSAVSATVTLRREGGHGYAIDAALEVRLPGVTDEGGRREVVELAKARCPLADGFGVSAV